MVNDGAHNWVGNCNWTTPEMKWLLSVAGLKLNLSGVDEVAEASLDWLASAPDSSALVKLADDGVRADARIDDVLGWIDDVFSDLGHAVAREDELRWLAVLHALRIGQTVEQGLVSCGELEIIERYYPLRLDLFSGFVNFQYELDGGASPASVGSEILYEIEVVRPRAQRLARAEIPPDSRWMFKAL